MSTDSIRVALLSEFLELGGQERVIETLARGLSAPFEAIVIGTAGGGAIAERLKAAGIPVILPGLPDIYARGSAARLAGLLKAEGVRIVHAHAYAAGVLGRRAARRAGISARIAHYHSAYASWGWRHRWMERRLARGTRAVVCVSEAVGEFARSRVGIPDSKVRVIRNGVPGDFAAGAPERAAARAALGLAPGDFVAACVANFSPHKGHAVLLEAARILAGSGRGAPPRLLLVGSGPGESDLRAAAGDRMPGSVLFAGRLEDPRIALAAADLLVLPSVEREGLGLSILEAMAMGMPVVASRLGGIPEAVEDGVTGVLAAPGDPAALAKGIDGLRSDPARARRMGEAGRERCLRLFSAGAMLRSIEALYREALGAP